MRLVPRHGVQRSEEECRKLEKGVRVGKRTAACPRRWIYPMRSILFISLVCPRLVVLRRIKHVRRRKWCQRRLLPSLLWKGAVELALLLHPRPRCPQTPQLAQLVFRRPPRACQTAGATPSAANPHRRPQHRYHHRRRHHRYLFGREGHPGHRSRPPARTTQRRARPRLRCRPRLAGVPAGSAGQACSMVCRLGWPVIGGKRHACAGWP